MMSDHDPKLIVCICPGNADSLAQDRCTDGGCVKRGVCVDCPVHEEAPEEELPRLAGVTVSTRWLSRLFLPGETERLNSGLPEGAKYRYSFFDQDAEAVVLVYEHPSFMPRADGAPLVRLNFGPDQWMHNNFTGEIVIVNHAVEPEFHETLPPDWVPPELIRLWDETDPDGRRAMKEELESRHQKEASEDDLRAQSAILAQIVAKEGEEE